MKPFLLSRCLLFDGFLRYHRSHVRGQKARLAKHAQFF